MRSISSALLDYSDLISILPSLRYASGATIQILVFGVLAISLKDVAPSAHTMCESKSCAAW